ncbi:SSI family serine proteinase inhibitor [Actinoplanes sp. DH11]|uniref:SSI family serine proteinase inhibitor n=1 Tax=Actinoplanes sp. DH11 TaxID=2857011 RepID=UPI001E50269F|nr:SSI family serine proteinase inhibitor [Actinoplanes sp. DH11]
MIRTLLALTATGAALLAPAAPATAVGGGPAPRPAPRAVAEPGADLTLSYTAEAGYATAVKLTCDPVGGGHPEGAAACATLRRIDADPARLEGGDRMCILLYQPVTAQLKGVWQGRDVRWEHTYGNTCEMNRATGVLFQF